MTNVALLVCAALAGWPMFRGAPALTGNAPGNLPDKLELRWSYNTGAPVKSSPAIAAGKVFIGNDAGNLFALDIQTGQPLWTFKAGDSIEATPLVLNAVYAGSADGNLYALDLQTGKSNWVYKTDNVFFDFIDGTFADWNQTLLLSFSRNFNEFLLKMQV